MKHTKKLLAAVMAFAMVSAIAPMSAFADTQVKRDSSNQSGDMIATYDVKAKYTVTIPAGVTLDSENSVTANFKASEVMLESGQKIKVTLNSADHTESGATFHAQTEKGDSTATYTISKGETAVAVGDTVAEFTENGEQSLTFSKAEGATYAGVHTETLTFGIAVEEAVKAETLLTTLTFGGSSTYSETTSGVVSVTATNVTDYDARFGWLWFEEGSLSVTAKEGYTITKCVFIQNAKTPITDTEAPFEIHSTRGNITEDKTWAMDGVTSIEVYGYAN